MSNRLAQEMSPYLLQHAENPVDWYPWGNEAIQLSKEKDQPIFLSVGYSACHWCHVMEHESFEDEAIASIMNANFVCIKVDREERPDLDQIYMNAVQLMTGRGGWPMSVFLTPELRPFHSGTYWPPQPRMGMPGFGQILEALAEAWRERREQAVTTSHQVTEHLQQIGQSTATGEELTTEQLVAAARQLEQSFDFTCGGFGTAPKFPHPMDLRLLLRVWQRTEKQALLEMVCLNLDKMAQGGIYDHLGGGFARYSVDERWLVPHFEKMLYDNALLTMAYVDAYLVTQQPSYAQVIRETCDYVLTEMTDPQGGFYSTEDADSEGEEGKFYVWTVEEINNVLGDELGARFGRVYDVTPEGNFEGKNILNLRQTVAQAAKLHSWDPLQTEQQFAEARTELLNVRNQRVRPGKDDKVLTSWNGLMIEAMARAAVLLDEPRYRTAAQNAARFVLEHLRREDGRLLHSWRHGAARFDGYLDDYAYLILALDSLYEADFDENWIDEAVTLGEVLLRHFADDRGGGFFFTADDHEELIARNKDVHDSSVPSGNGAAATALARLGTRCGRSDFIAAAQQTLSAAHEVMSQSSIAAGQLWLAADFLLGPTREIVLVSEQTRPDSTEVVTALRQRFLPRVVVASRTAEHVRSAHLDPLFEGKPTESDPVAYVCEQFACQEPARGKDAILELWKRL
jgi:hypothetical protein